MAIKLSLKQVPVHFHSSTDTKLFVQKVYNDIKTRGLMLTDLNLIHCAMIHYQSRYKTSLSKRFRYTCMTIEPTLLEDKKHFYFDDGEKAELQTQSSEVIGVGFAIALFQRLFDVNFNCINEISNTGKRCDFEIFFKGVKIIAESKGRKGGLNQAIDEIIKQKAVYPSLIPKYGAISIIKRDIDPVEITVVDPPSEMEYYSRDDRILSILIYYTKVVQLAGYSELANLLNIRIEDIIKDKSKVKFYDKRSIEYKTNVDKIGYEIFTSIGEYKFCSFVHNNESRGFKLRIKDSLNLFFGLDETVKKYLENQDYDALLEFNKKYNYKINSNTVSIHNDGTCLILFDDKSLEKAEKAKKLSSIFGNNNIRMNINN